MLKLKKFSLFLALMFVCTVFYTPNAFAEGTGAGIGSLKNVKTPTSMESKMTFKLNLSAKNLSAEETQMMLQLAPILSNMIVTVDMKTVTNADNTLSSVYMNAGTTIAGMPLNFEIWVKSDMVGGTAKVLEIIKMPKNLPLLQTDKEYMVLDTATLAKTDSNATMPSFNPADMTDMTKKLTNIIYTLSDELNSKFNLIADKGSVTVKTPVGDETAHGFEIKLDDKSFKEVLKYSFDSLIQNKDFLSLITDLVKSMDTSKTTTVTDKEIADLTKGFNEFYDKIKDVKIIGDKGLVFGYALNPENFVISQNGVIDLVIDAPSISKIMNSTTTPALAGTSALPKAANEPTGIYNLTIELENINFNINKAITIDFPVLTKENSQSLEEMLSGMLGTTTTPQTKPATTTKKAVTPVKKVVAPVKKVVTSAKKTGTAKKPAKKIVKKTIPVKKISKKSK